MQSWLKQEEAHAKHAKDEPLDSREDPICPRCGGKMVASAHQVVAEFPAPALERFVCSEVGCNYSRYVKLDSPVSGEEIGTIPAERESSAK